MLHPLLPPKLTTIDQPIFWRRWDGHSIIDPLRAFVDSRNYRARELTAPGSAAELFAGRATVESQFTLKPGSFLIQVSAISTAAPPNDFRYEILDLGSQRSLSSQPVRYMLTTGGIANSRFPNRPLPFVLPSPLVVTEPGSLNVRIVNLSANANTISLLLLFAEPIL